MGGLLTERYYGQYEPPHSIDEMTLERVDDGVAWFDDLSDLWKDTLARDAIKVLKYGMTLLSKESTD